MIPESLAGRGVGWDEEGRVDSLAPQTLVPYYLSYLWMRMRCAHNSAVNSRCAVMQRRARGSSSRRFRSSMAMRTIRRLVALALPPEDGV